MILRYEHLVEVRGGDRFVIGECVHKISHDVKCNGGYRCGNLSVVAAFNTYPNIEWIRYAS